MLKKSSVKIGRLVKKAMRLRGGGSALPGLVVEKMTPNFLKSALADLPYGVVVVSGTNGKTTTTKIVVELLRAHGLKVFTNPSGSNFTRGIVASLLDHVDKNGKLNADVAVLELDEAHAVHFANQSPPRYTLILNVFRDQLDRFGEIDKVAGLLLKVVEKTTQGVVLNYDDELVRNLEKHVDRDKKLQYFSVAKKLKELFPSDKNSLDNSKPNTPYTVHKNDVQLTKLDGQNATFSFGKTKARATILKLHGIYNAQNAAGALALARMILDDKFIRKTALKALENIKPAFGRGEAVEIDSQPLEIVLIKNPSGFRLALASYAATPAKTLIAVNDKIADGRDMSWLWDVDFTSLQDQKEIAVSGIRAYDMALRLQYDDVKVGKISTSITNAVDDFITSSKEPKRIFCTYTAMLELRRHLAKTYDVEAIE